MCPLLGCDSWTVVVWSFTDGYMDYTKSLSETSGEFVIDVPTGTEVAVIELVLCNSNDCVNTAYTADSGALEYNEDITIFTVQ